MRVALAGLAAVAISGCGPAKTGGPALLDEAEAMAGLGGPVPHCTMSTLPLTGACTDANPALFMAVDRTRETFARGCVWKTEEVKLSEGEAIVFRAQDCTGEHWDAQIYSLVGAYLKNRPAPLVETEAGFMLEIFPLGDGQSPEQAALTTLANAPEDQRGRCVTQPLDGFKAVGQVFELGPNAELTAEMKEYSPDEPWDACGPNGVTMDAIQYWEGRGRHALFHMVGQDDPVWDPASFTFYVRNPDGSWSKKD